MPETFVMFHILTLLYISVPSVIFIFFLIQNTCHYRKQIITWIGNVQLSVTIYHRTKELIVFFVTLKSFTVNFFWIAPKTMISIAEHVFNTPGVSEASLTTAPASHPCLPTVHTVQSH